MNNLLISLYKEHDLLLEKLEKIRATIIAYGGDMLKDPTAKYESTDSEADLNEIPAEYPSKGKVTWRARILYVLKSDGGFLSANEIAIRIKENEPDLNTQNIAQFCSGMALRSEIQVNRKEREYKYASK